MKFRNKQSWFINTSKEEITFSAKEALERGIQGYRGYESGELETMKDDIDTLQKFLVKVMLMLPQERYLEIINDMGYVPVEE